MNLRLTEALRFERSDCIAFIGAGGKTTSMFLLAREAGTPVIVTTTTHLGADQIQLADHHIEANESLLANINNDLRGVVVVTGPILEGRATAPSLALLEQLHQFCKEKSIPLLIEADGARGKSLKGWADHEPAIPDFVDSVVQVAGLEAIGKPLTEETIHRSEIFSAQSGLGVNEIVSPKDIVKALTHPRGALKNIAVGVRKIVLLNQADTDSLQSLAHGMTGALFKTYHSVVITSVKEKRIYSVHEPIAGVILAAGGSIRFGQPKQLLDWKGQPFVRAVTKTALEAGLSPVIVVTGAHGNEVSGALKGLNIVIVKNEEWQNGQGSSIRAGVLSLAKIRNKTDPNQNQELTFEVGGAIFLLADQPQVNTAILHSLAGKHAEGLFPIVAPMVLDRRGNPVLFDRVTFADLMKIEGDTGGRAIFHKHRVEYLPWHDDSLLLDVDTPDQYQRLISQEDS